MQQIVEFQDLLEMGLL